MSQESEHENRRRISEMEKDASGIEELSCTFYVRIFVLVFVNNYSAAQYESSLIKLSNAEIQIEDLKMQLDDALGAEEMLVQLTERNLMLGEVPKPFLHF
jgi:dynactin 1